MSLSSYFNKKALNSTLSDTIKKYDTDENGFTKKEFYNAITGITSIFAKNIIKLTRYDKKIFKQLDTDKNSIVSYEEMSQFIKDEYNLDFFSFMEIKLKNMCEEIDNTDYKNYD